MEYPAATSSRSILYFQKFIITNRVGNRKPFTLVLQRVHSWNDDLLRSGNRTYRTYAEMCMLLERKLYNRECFQPGL